MKNITLPPNVTKIINELIEKANSFSSSSSSLPSDEVCATHKLKVQGLTEYDINQRAEAFKVKEGVSKAALLANYELLHGVQELDKAFKSTEEYNCHAESIIAVYRGSEICLYNLESLTAKIVSRIHAGETNEAACDMLWCCYFHDTLHKLSQLVLEFDHGEEDGDYLDVNYSPSFVKFKHNLAILHKAMQTVWKEMPEHIQEKDLDDPQRYIFFNEYVNTNYQRIWLSSLSKIRLPGIFAKANESGSDFFQRIVNTHHIREAVGLVDLKHPTSLLQFRAYHQISEVFVKCINKWVCLVVAKLLSNNEADLLEAARILSLCNKLLWIVNDNLKPIMRALSPKAYFAIRPALGITSGSHSYNLRKGLFNTVYPLLVKSIRLKLSKFDPELMKNDDVIYAHAKEILINMPHGDLAECIRQIVYIHQHIRLWRDDHIQFIKTQIGISPENEKPMASISGAQNASSQAHQFRTVHSDDPVAPLYKAVLGKPIPPTHELLNENEFDEFMARQTAIAANSMYPDIQYRVINRRSKTNKSAT